MFRFLKSIFSFEHKEAFDRFVLENGIDLADLSSFEIDEADELEKQRKRCPFEEFDDAFYEMEPICDYLSKYARKNISEFAQPITAAE